MGTWRTFGSLVARPSTDSANIFHNQQDEDKHMPHLFLEIANQVATITLNNPPQNRLAEQMIGELDDALTSMGHSDVRPYCFAPRALISVSVATSFRGKGCPMRHSDRFSNAT